MEFSRTSFFWSIGIAWCICFLHQSNAQIGAKNTVPETVASCYKNTTAYNRYTRQPMHIDNLVSIIRKIERKDPQWDMRRILRTLVNRYMFDGIEFHPSAKEDFQFNPKAQEASKSALVKKLIPIPIEEMFPAGALDNDEMCALHWMLSHSMNSTIRDEELYNGYNGNGYNNNPGGYNPGNGYNNNPNPSGQNRWRRSLDEDDKGDVMEDSDDSKNEQPAQEDPVVQKDPKSDSSPNTDTNDNTNETPEIIADSKEPAENKNPPPKNFARSVLPGVANDGDDAPKLAKQVSQKDPNKTRRPIETGVVYTPWGSISAGRLIAGLAAALEPMTIQLGSGTPYIPSNYGNGGSSGYGSYPGQSSAGSNPFNQGANNNPFGGNNNNNNPLNNGYNPNSNYPAKNQYQGRRKRRQIAPITFQPLQSIYAVTLAGDVGQAAVLNAQHQIGNIPLPRGTWNDTICPREYILEQHPYADKEIYEDSASFTFMTEAEIRGGMDGLILGMNMNLFDPSRTLKLSELLSMYYSENGIAGQPEYRSCSRGMLFSRAVETNTLKEQSRSFAYYYNNQTQYISQSVIEQNPNPFLQLVDDAYQRMWSVTGNVGSSDPNCKRRQGVTSSAVETDDSLKFTEVKSNIYAVLDHTGTYDDIIHQKRFLGQLAHEINVSPRGSRLGIMDGSSGMIVISPNFTDNNAILACNILSLPTQIKSQDIVKVLNNMRTELERTRNEEERTGYESNLGTILLIMVQGRKLEDSQKAEIYRLLKELDEKYGDTKVIFTSSKYQQSDFDGFVLNPEKDFIRIQGVQNISDFADEFTNLLKDKALARLTYTKCNANKHNQNEEHKVASTFYVKPDSILYSRISPDYFYSAKNLRLRFTSDNGKVRICQSRTNPSPNSRNEGSDGVTCKETKGSYVTPGNSEIDVEFSHSKPCGKHGDRSGCRPIYLSFTPTLSSTPGQVGYDCAVEGCESPNEVKVTFTHWDMRCNGGFHAVLSLPMAIAMTILSLLTWRNST